MILLQHLQMMMMKMKYSGKDDEDEIFAHKILVLGEKSVCLMLFERTFCGKR